MSNVFELQEANDELVVIKVNADDPLTIAMHPYINSNMAYISVTRGKDHVLTVINKDGKTWSFHWGNGYTLISESTEILKRKVIEFIQDENHILLGNKGGDIIEATIYYNSNFRKWQLTLEDSNNGVGRWWSDTAKTYEDMITEALPYTNDCTTWEHRIAPTGIDCWDAVL